jgi:8-oxo-dGTP diphosphatase
LIVVAAALTDPVGRILLQLRRKSSEHGGLWEFPGGKIEPDEHPQSALVREIAEELGLIVSESALVPLGFAASDAAAARPIILLLYRCNAWTGEPECLDAEAIAWVEPQDFASLAMPPLDIDLARNALGVTM